MNKISLSIVDIKKETEDATTICFKQPGIRKVKYQAGQYLTLILRINGRQYLRPYSFSSAPSVDKLLEITVKRIELGIVSNFICNNLKIGDVVEAIEPMGDFVYNPLNSTKNIFLWGVGSGITPLYSILKELLNGQIINDYNIHLVYGNKDQKSTIFHDNLKSLQSKFSDNFEITNFYSRGTLDVDIESNKIGRISKDYIDNLFSEGKLNDSFHFICGPNALKELITNCLKSFNILSSNILSEEFNLFLSREELVNVQDSEVNIVFNGVNSTIKVLKGKSILDVALDCGIDIPYTCQTGNCNTCIGILKKGRIKMIGVKNNKLDDLAQNEFLLCCSYPESGQVTLEVI